MNVDTKNIVKVLLGIRNIKETTEDQNIYGALTDQRGSLLNLYHLESPNWNSYHIFYMAISQA
jgi:hypothetical protein